jgi:hypothetical protein
LHVVLAAERVAAEEDAESRGCVATICSVRSRDVHALAVVASAERSTGELGQPVLIEAGVFLGLRTAAAGTTVGSAATSASGRLLELVENCSLALNARGCSTTFSCNISLSILVAMLILLLLPMEGAAVDRGAEQVFERRHALFDGELLSRVAIRGGWGRGLRFTMLVITIFNVSCASS